MSGRYRILWALGGLLAVIALINLLIRAKDLIEPSAEPTIGAPACDLGAGPCTARLPDGGEVTLSVEPRPIPLLRPLALRVVIGGLQADATAVDFLSTDMDMGYNRPSLAADGPGRFRGEGMLPTCTRSHMNWEARVLLTTPRGPIVVPFRFETKR
jgi:hypothetical protein